MEIKAQLRHLRIAPRKVRLVLDLVRGLDINEAENQLKLMPKRASGPVLKLLNSAIANAKNNKGIDKENLYIDKIFANEGPTLKRWLPRAFGRATPINKRSSHIMLILKPVDSKANIKAKSELTAREKLDKKDIVKPSNEAVSQTKKGDKEKRKAILKDVSRKSQKQPSIMKKVFRRKTI